MVTACYIVQYNTIQGGTMDLIQLLEEIASDAAALAPYYTETQSQYRIARNIEHKAKQALIAVQYNTGGYNEAWTKNQA